MRVLDTSPNCLAKFEWGDYSNNGSEVLALMDLSVLMVGDNKLFMIDPAYLCPFQSLISMWNFKIE
jgi:hypothetical protein